jgi:hypothetical protein
MYEWVRNHQAVTGRPRCRKRVFDGYRIQELLWGKKAKQQVYDAYGEGVRGNV